MCNYTTKSDLKKTAGVDTSKFSIKAYLVVIKLDANKLKSVPVDLKKLNNVVLVNLLKKQNMIKTYTDDVEGKIPNAFGLAITT